MDSKHRLIVPSDLRRAMTQMLDDAAMFLVMGYNGKLWAYPEKSYMKMTERAPELIPTDDDAAFDDLHFAMADRVVVDTQGRMSIPDRLFKRSKLKVGEIAVLGKRDHIEFWPTEDWEKRQDELEPQRPVIAQRVKKARQVAVAPLNQASGQPAAEPVVAPEA